MHAQESTLSGSDSQCLFLIFKANQKPWGKNYRSHIRYAFIWGEDNFSGVGQKAEYQLRIALTVQFLLILFISSFIHSIDSIDDLGCAEPRLNSEPDNAILFMESLPDWFLFGCYWFCLSLVCRYFLVRIVTFYFFFSTLKTQLHRVTGQTPEKKHNSFPGCSPFLGDRIYEILRF